MKIKSHHIQLLLVCIIVCLPFLLHAQPGFDDDVVDDVPIDGGLSILLSTGIGYGVKKIYSSNNKKTKQ